MQFQKTFLFILALFFFLGTACQEEKQEDSLLFDPEYVNMKGEESQTIIKNSSGDTLSLSFMHYNYVLKKEHSFSETLLPGTTDTFQIAFSYPGFIYFSSHNQFKIFNAPGGRVTCQIKNIQAGTQDIRFQGDFADVNEYYLTKQKQLGTLAESSAYYEAGNKLKNFARFPALADSINQLSLTFLEKYDQPLPDWFKTHEFWRLKYNAAFRKQNVPFSREFYEGKTLAKGPAYYDFEKELGLEPEGMIFGEELYNYAMFYLSRRALEQNENRRYMHYNMLGVLDSQLQESQAADMFKNFILSRIYQASNKQYDSLIERIPYHDPSNKQILYSLLNDKRRKPIVGQTAPDFTLQDIDGNLISLSDWSNDLVMLNFWATWCGGCIKEFPYENKWHEKYKDKGLKVINLCVQSEKGKWKEISEKNNLQMLNLFAEDHQYETIKAQYGIGALPRSILIGPGLIVKDNELAKASWLTEPDIEKLLDDSRVTVKK